MSRERHDRLDPSEPTLIIQTGNTRRKHRPLDRDVMVLGRAPGCDVGLESPDVAPVHCVVVRAADGWHVHDCTGKGGTRVNGDSVYDAALTDGDVLQVGSFSFLLHLPPEHRPPAGVGTVADDPDLPRAQRSRHNLARMALRLRGRVAELEAAVAARDGRDSAALRQELDRRAAELSARQKEMDARAAELKQAATAVAARDGRDSAALRQQLDRRAAELSARQKEADARAAELKQAAQAVAAQKAEVEERRGKVEAAAADAGRPMEIRSEELRRYAQHLRRLRERLNEHEESLTARWEEWLREQQEASVGLERQREKARREEGLLRDQRAEVVRLMAEMRQVRKLPEGMVESLRDEVEQLRRALAERESAAAAAREEAESLRARLEEQKHAPAEPEAGLERFHVELDTGRRVLDEQIREVQGRFASLERAAREAEGHIARERERIAQELQELERLRGGLGLVGGPSPCGETLADTPSPLHHVLNNTPAEAAVAAT
jgi:pSer/pThr/pTyr-binding forkhead associated (FHA) protein